MQTADVFSIVNLIAMPMWLLMIVLPKWKGTRFLIDYKVIPIVLASVYLLYIIRSVTGGGSFDFGSLESVMALFTQEEAVLAGWVHYLCFDLLVGMWIVNQNKSLKIHPILIGLCLVGTFMLGPVGFLLFMLFRSFKLSKS